MIINVDLDGVVVDFHKAFDRMYFWNGDLKKELAKSDVWNAWEYLGISEGQFSSMIRRGVQSGSLWTTDPVIFGARETLWRLSDDGYDIRIVTSRLMHKFGHAHTIKATADWLEKEDIPYRTICFLGPNESKADYRADYAIDDNADHVRAMDDAGIDAVLFERPWNKDESGVLHIHYWREFYDYVRASS